VIIEKMVNSSWKDIDTHGRRLVKIIKILESRIPKTKDDIDGLSRLAATIGNLTRQTVTLIQIADHYDEIMLWFSALKQDETAIKKHNIRQMQKNTQHDKLNMQHEIEEEKSVRIQMKTRDKLP